MVLPYFQSDDMDIGTIEVFENSLFGGTNQRSCSILPTEALKKH